MVDMNGQGDGAESGRKYLRSVIYFAITILVVTILGAVFTNATIQSDFTAAAVASAGLITVILILGVVKFIEL
jgi:hypothetical protein